MDGLGTASSASPRGSSESLRKISFRTFSDLQRLIDRENVLRAQRAKPLKGTRCDKGAANVGLTLRLVKFERSQPRDARLPH